MARPGWRFEERGPYTGDGLPVAGAEPVAGAQVLGPNRARVECGIFNAGTAMAYLSHKNNVSDKDWPVPAGAVFNFERAAPGNALYAVGLAGADLRVYEISPDEVD